MDIKLTVTVNAEAPDDADKLANDVQQLILAMPLPEMGCSVCIVRDNDSNAHCIGVASFTGDTPAALAEAAPLTMGVGIQADCVLTGAYVGGPLDALAAARASVADQIDDVEQYLAARVDARAIDAAFAAYIESPFDDGTAPGSIVAAINHRLRAWRQRLKAADQRAAPTQLLTGVTAGLGIAFALLLLRHSRVRGDE